MNKRAEFDWGMLSIILFVLFFLIGIALLAVSSENSAQEKHERLCEKKGLEYFGFDRGDWGRESIVICLDKEGEQIEVELK